MSSLVIYESYFGNTRAIAEAIASGLGSQAIPLSHLADLPADLTLLLVGAPTHNLGLPKQASRAKAAERGGTTDGPGIREWPAGLRAHPGVRVITFDTSTSTAMGTASKAAVHTLKRAGFRGVERGETFKVAGTEGPLADGELERARAWGASLRPGS